MTAHEAFDLLAGSVLAANVIAFVGLVASLMIHGGRRKS